MQPPILLFVEELKERVKEMMKEAEKIKREIKENAPSICWEEQKESKKEYALFINSFKSIPPKYKSFFLKMREVLRDDQIDVQSQFFIFLQKGAWSSNFFSSSWKQTNVPEIVNEEKNQSKSRNKK